MSVSNETSSFVSSGTQFLVISAVVFVICWLFQRSWKREAVKVERDWSFGVLILQMSFSGFVLLGGISVFEGDNHGLNYLLSAATLLASGLVGALIFFRLTTLAIKHIDQSGITPDQEAPQMVPIDALAFIKNVGRDALWLLGALIAAGVASTAYALWANFNGAWLVSHHVPLSVLIGIVAFALVIVVRLKFCKDKTRAQVQADKKAAAQKLIDDKTAAQAAKKAQADSIQQELKSLPEVDEFIMPRDALIANMMLKPEDREKLRRILSRHPDGLNKLRELGLQPI